MPVTKSRVDGVQVMHGGRNLRPPRGTATEDTGKMPVRVKDIGGDLPEQARRLQKVGRTVTGRVETAHRGTARFDLCGHRSAAHRADHLDPIAPSVGVPHQRLHHALQTAGAESLHQMDDAQRPHRAPRATPARTRPGSGEAAGRPLAGTRSPDSCHRPAPATRGSTSTPARWA